MADPTVPSLEELAVGLRVLTVQQPWAWAIVAGGKLVENRTTRWAYRGPLAIHAGTRWSPRGGASLLVAQAYADAGGPFSDLEVGGAVIGLVDLAGAHDASPECCAPDGSCWPWGEDAYEQADGARRSAVVHLVLRNPIEFARPIPARGRLGLWHPDPDLLLEIAHRAQEPARVRP